MGLRNIVAGGILALSSLGISSCTTPHFGKVSVERAAKPELTDLVNEATALARKQHYPTGLPCDHNHEREVELWEDIVKISKNKHYNDGLNNSKKHLSVHKMYQGRLLLEYTDSLVVRELAKFHYDVKDVKGAKRMAHKFLRESIAYANEVLKASPDHANAWKQKGDCHGFLEEYEDSKKAYREYIRLNQDNFKAYVTLAALYQAQDKQFHFIDELELLKGVNAETRRKNIANAFIMMYDRAFSALKQRADKLKEKTGQNQLKLRANFQIKGLEEAEKASQMFYLTSAVRWEEEMKKELGDRDHIRALTDLFWAGSIDYAMSRTPERQKASLDRFENGYKLINSGMGDGLKRLDVLYYDLVLKQRSITFSRAGEVWKALKERYARQF